MKKSNIHTPILLTRMKLSDKNPRPNNPRPRNIPQPKPVPSPDRKDLPRPGTNNPYPVRVGAGHPLKVKHKESYHYK